MNRNLLTAAVCVLSAPLFLLAAPQSDTQTQRSQSSSSQSTTSTHQNRKYRTDQSGMSRFDQMSSHCQSAQQDLDQAIAQNMNSGRDTNSSARSENGRSTASASSSAESNRLLEHARDELRQCNQMLTDMRSMHNQMRRDQNPSTDNPDSTNPNR